MRYGDVWKISLNWINEKDLKNFKNKVAIWGQLRAELTFDKKKAFGSN